jgi:hypothetical protein
MTTDTMFAPTMFAPPKALVELQGRFVDAVLEAADESAKRFETAIRETAETFASAAHANAERSIEAMSVSSKLRTKTLGIAREAIGLATAAPATK